MATCFAVVSSRAVDGPIGKSAIRSYQPHSVSCRDTGHDNVQVTGRGRAGSSRQKRCQMRSRATGQSVAAARCHAAAERRQAASSSSRDSRSAMLRRWPEIFRQIRSGIGRRERRFDAKLVRADLNGLEQALAVKLIDYGSFAFRFHAGERFLHLL